MRTISSFPPGIVNRPQFLLFRFHELVKRLAQDGADGGPLLGTLRPDRIGVVAD